MHKAFPIFSFLFFSASTLLAQPTLTSVTNNPVVGDMLFYHVCDTTGVNKGASGPAVTWNFSSLIQTALDTTEYVSCSSTPYCDSFTASNIVATDLHGNYSYYIINSGAFSYLGYENATISLRYSNPVDYIYFPLSYNSTHFDVGLSTFSTGSLMYSDSFICDGYGTLILPTGTFNNVLRIHEIQFGTEIISSVTYNWRTDYYLWYTSGIHTAICNMGFDTTGTGISHISYVGYISKNTTGIQNISILNNSVALFPNPANNELTITTNENAYSSVSIFNSVGTQVLYSGINTKMTNLNISNLPAGIYFLKLEGNGGKSIRRFEKI